MTPVPNPALVTQEAVHRLPRLALWVFCAAYVLPGLFGRDPWRNADLSAFGQMLAIAEGRSSWLVPSLGGMPTGAALLPNWIGAASIGLGSGWLDAPLAARLPFAALLAWTLVAVWYAAYHLARTDAAQPLPLAFGGEASPVDYARAIADGALLATIASLGLLQLGHETTPELAQLAAVASYQWALSAAHERRWTSRAIALIGLPALAASDAPALAVALGMGSVVLCWRSPRSTLRGFAPWTLAATALAILVAWPVHAWQWRLGAAIEPMQVLRLLVWFLWPAWALAALTVWRWRSRLGDAHLAIPLLILGVALVASIAMGGSDRALMLAIPGLALLAAFALPTLQRSTAAAIDWFSVFFFSLAAASIWLFYIAMQTGVPAKPAANLARLLSGFQPSFSLAALLIALAGTVAWLWLVRWRTGRHRAALWKSLVLPAGGVALAWLLLMTLWLPALDHARSWRPTIERIQTAMPAGACVAAPGAAQALVAALEYHARRAVDADPKAASNGRCDVVVMTHRGAQRPTPGAGWREVTRERRPTDKQEWLVVYRRQPKPTPTR